jgi:inositol transport system permease protein
MAERTSRLPSDSTPARPQRSWMDFISQYGIVLVLVLLTVAMSVLSPILREGQQLFLTPNNLIQVALQASINCIIAVGMTYVITSGGIDLSVGSMVALCGVLAAMAMRDFPQIGPWGGFTLAVIVGVLCGLVNGVLITQLNLSPFIATLGTMGIFRGIGMVISEGRSIYQFDTAAFRDIFASRIPLGIGGIELPIAVLFAAGLAGFFWFMLAQTRLGKYTVAIGGNEETARVAGIPIVRYKLLLYMLCGLLTGVAAALLMARLSSGDPTFGGLFELNAIAAVVMGGTRLSGGQGTIAGTIVGALIISLVQNAMNIFNVPSYWQQVIIGGVIVFAVVLDQLRRRQSQTG